MQYLLTAILLGCVRIDEALVHPPQLCARTEISPIRYGYPRSFARPGVVLALLRFGTSALYRIGAMMGEAELALGVNVVE